VGYQVLVSLVDVGLVVLAAVVAGALVVVPFAVLDHRRRRREPAETSHLLSDD
jgi:hypothetical protein